MSDQDLVVEAQAWRRRATALLDASGLTRILSSHGRLALCGAYAYDTMMPPDIDLHLIPSILLGSSAKKQVSEVSSVDDGGLMSRPSCSSLGTQEY